MVDITDSAVLDFHDYITLKNKNCVQMLELSNILLHILEQTVAV